MNVRFLSLFSGIEAASEAWLPFGWQCVGVAEIEKFPSAVLAHRHPNTPNFGDIAKITEEQIKALGPIDVIVGGFPCQDLSIAGKRKGLKNEDGSNTRSGLFFVAMQIVQWARKHNGLRWLLVENVPGLLSSGGGGDFAAVLGEMVGTQFDPPAGKWENTGMAIGPDGLAEWCLLDAQWFGVAQRRKRVFSLCDFSVRDFGIWSRSGPVLFEPESLLGDSPPSREKGKGITHSTAPRLTSSGRGVGRTGETRGQDPVVAVWPAEIAPALNASFGDKQGLEDQHALNGGGCSFPPPTSLCLNAGGMGRSDAESETLIPTRQGGFFDDAQPIAFNHNAQAAQLRSAGRDTTLNDGLTCSRGAAVCQPTTLAIRGRADGLNLETRDDGTANAVLTPSGGRAGTGVGAIQHHMSVRRLTPTECERLQGFPDGHTNIPWKKKPAEQCPNGPRYKALGNSMAVPCMAWLGRRIQAAHTAGDTTP